ncbi:hypothetical protein LCGC14_2791700, partial [marine sediment metagenome]
DTQLGNNPESDIVGINTAPVIDQMLTGRITQRTNVGSGLEVLGIRTIVNWFGDSNGGTDSTQGYGQIIDLNIAGDDGTTDEEGKQSFGLVIDVDDNSTFSFSDQTHETTGLDIDVTHSGGTSGFSTLTNIGIDLDMSGNTVSAEKIGLDIQVVGSSTTTYGIKMGTISGGSSNSWGIFDSSNTGWALDRDNKELFFGASQDASIDYNGSDLLIKPNVIGTGKTYFDNDVNIENDLDVGVNISADGDVISNAFFGSGEHLTNLPVVNPFDQSLNTTDDVIFKDIIAKDTQPDFSVDIIDITKFGRVIFLENGISFANIQGIGSQFTTVSRRKNLEFRTSGATGNDMMFSPGGVLKLILFKGGHVEFNADVVINETLNVSKNATFDQDVIIVGTLFGGSPVKIAGGLIIDGGN